VNVRGQQTYSCCPFKLRISATTRLVGRCGPNGRRTLPADPVIRLDQILGWLPGRAGPGSPVV